MSLDGVDDPWPALLCYSAFLKMMASSRRLLLNSHDLHALIRASLSRPMFVT